MILLAILKWLVITVLGLAALILLVRFIGQTYCRITPKGGINETKCVEINGVKQWFSIYGKDKNNPVLLFLHGGPGGALSYADYGILRQFSDVYTVVGWDQRYCGKSHIPGQKTEPLTRESFLGDGIELTKYLLNYLHKDKLTLLTNSWGSSLGTHLVDTHPELYDGIINTSLVVDLRLGQRDYFIPQAMKWTENDPEMRKLAESMDPDTFDSMEWSSLLARYCPESIYSADVCLPLILFFNPYYSLKDLYDWFTREREPRTVEFVQRGGFDEFSLCGIEKLEVPFYVIQGDEDYQAPHEFARWFFDRLDAPDKEFFYVKGHHMAPMLQTKNLAKTVHTLEKRIHNR